MPSQSATPSFKIATPEVMQCIKTVLVETATPSWIGSVPSNFGDAAAGTIKADEWRTLATIYLPLALISLWGYDNQTTSRLRDILDHTMDLFCAARLVCLRTMTKSRSTAYRTLMARYISMLHKIYPETSYKSTHHLALHLYDFLQLFGPVHSWWTFPFERLIGILLRLPHNHKSGNVKTLHH